MMVVLWWIAIKNRDLWFCFITSSLPHAQYYYRAKEKERERKLNNWTPEGEKEKTDIKSREHAVTGVQIYGNAARME
jgi:hypothetical protein